MVVDVEIREYKRIGLDRREQSQQRYMGLSISRTSYDEEMLIMSVYLVCKQVNNTC